MVKFDMTSDDITWRSCDVHWAGAAAAIVAVWGALRVWFAALSVCMACRAEAPVQAATDQGVTDWAELDSHELAQRTDMGCIIDLRTTARNSMWHFLRQESLRQADLPDGKCSGSSHCSAEETRLAKKRTSQTPWPSRNDAGPGSAVVPLLINASTAAAIPESGARLVCPSTSRSNT